jgi:hypothetical protein
MTFAVRPMDCNHEPKLLRKLCCNPARRSHTSDRTVRSLVKPLESPAFTWPIAASEVYFDLLVSEKTFVTSGYTHRKLRPRRLG